MRALSTRNDEPERASRPFDKDRDGFVVGEGAGVLILEELESRAARGARIYAELVGYGMSADAYHITAPSEDGDGAFRVDAGGARRAPASQPPSVDYINAHGTSTPLGDTLETLAIKRCFGEHAQQARGVVDQVDDRPPARRRRRPRGRHHRARRPPPDRAADDQPRPARRRLRPRLRAAQQRGRCRSSTRCRTRSASAAPTPRCCSSDTSDELRELAIGDRQ